MPDPPTLQPVTLKSWEWAWGQGFYIWVHTATLHIVGSIEYMLSNCKQNLKFKPQKCFYLQTI